MRRGQLLNLTLACALLAASACESDDPNDFQEQAQTSNVRMLPPVGLSTGVWWVDTEADEGVLVRGRGDLQTVALPPNPRWSEARLPDGREALVLCDGLRGVGESAVLTVIEGGATQRTYTVGAPFTAAAQTSDGSHAVLFFQRGGDALAFSPNALSIVDLAANGAVTARSVETRTGPPTGVWASPRMELDGAPLHVAVVASFGQVALLDLEQPSLPAVTIALSSVASGGVVPRQVSFSAARREVYVRGEGRDDVYVLTLESAGAERQNRFWPRVDARSATMSPSDMAFVDQGEPRLLVAGAGGDELVQIVLGSEATRTTPLDIPVTRVLPLPPLGDGSAPARALLYGPGESHIAFARLPAGGDALVDVVPLAAPVLEAENLSDQGFVLLKHSDNVLSLVNTATQGVTLLNLETAAQSEHAGTNQPVLWLADAGDTLVAALDLPTGVTYEVLLDHPIAGFVALPGGERVAVVHTSPEPALTFLPARAPNREQAVLVEGLR